MTNRAVFFDRDDTVIRNVPYLGDPSQVALLATVKESLSLLKDAGFLLFIVSNQSGVGRGYITREQVALVNEEMIRQLGAPYFTQIYNSYAAPDDPDAELDRKPSPGLLLRAAEEYGLDLSRSYMVGDRAADVRCGRRAGARVVLVMTGPHEDEKREVRSEADFVAHSLLEAAQWILSDVRATKGAS